MDGVLASFPRVGPEGEPAVLRVHLNEFDGRLICHVRQWVQGNGRQWSPTKLGLTVRLGEIDAMIAALGRAKAAMLDDAACRSTDRRVEQNAPPFASSPAVPPKPKADSGLRGVPPWESN